MNQPLVRPPERKSDVSALSHVIASRGMAELQLSPTTVGVTLLRSVSRMGDWGAFLAESAREGGPHSFEMAIIPFRTPSLAVSTAAVAAALQRARDFASPPTAIQARPLPLHGPLSRTLRAPHTSALATVAQSGFLFSRPPSSPAVGGHTDGTAPLPPIHLRPPYLPPHGSFVRLEPASLVLSAITKVHSARGAILT